MSINRILGVLVITALLIVAGLTIYNASNTISIGSTAAQGYQDQRVGEWSAGNGSAEALDQHDRHLPSPVNALYQQRVGEWQAGTDE